MVIRIQYQGITGSPWMDQYMEGKLTRFERYLSPGAQIEILLAPSRTQLFIQNLSHEYTFEEEGFDLFEAFSKVFELACKVLKADHRRIINKIHRSGVKGQTIEL